MLALAARRACRTLHRLPIRPAAQLREATSEAHPGTIYHDPHGRSIESTPRLEVIVPSPRPIPCFRVLNNEGVVDTGAEVPQIADEQLVDIYRKMVTLRQMDSTLYEAQRQGRVSFYMTSTGEEASTIASAAALEVRDPVFSQYREQGVLLHRGWGVDKFIHQCFSTRLDTGKGRQMPVHYGSKELNFHVVSSPLCTQVPQAVGAAYALKRENSSLPLEEKKIAATYFGEGAASEGDFHAAMNFAATLKVPVMFICRNNAFAISTHVHDQFAGDGIVARAAGYGMKAMRVDGNDALAVYHAVKQARNYIVAHNEPMLVELMSYRVGHHSTSDDSTRYRAADDIQQFRASNCPLQRLGNYLTSRGLWSTLEEQQLVEQCRADVMAGIKSAEAEPKTPLSDLFGDVYDTEPAHLRKQRQQLKQHVDKYKEHYTGVLRAKRIRMDIDM